MVSQHSTALDFAPLPHGQRNIEVGYHASTRTNLHGIDLWTGCEPCLNSLAVFLCDATPPLTSDEDSPLGIFTSTAIHQSMRFDGLTDKCIHHSIKGIVREVVRNLKHTSTSQFLKFTYVQLLAQAFSHQALTRYG